jgi:transcription initiation factor TFIIIB Brf1 subunit/transcription initiation factor TFIIB
MRICAKSVIIGQFVDDDSNSEDRTLLKVFDKMSAGSTAGGLPACAVDKGAVLYSMMGNDSIRRGSTLQRMVAAPVYYALKDRGYFRSSKEMAQMFGVKHKSMTTGQREFQKIMYHRDKDFVRDAGRAVTPEEFVRRFAVDLHLPDHIVVQIVRAAQIEREYHLAMHNKPESIAVALISIVCAEIGYKLDKKNLSKVCNISKVTISKATKHLEQYRTTLFPISGGAAVRTQSESC